MTAYSVRSSSLASSLATSLAVTLCVATAAGQSFQYVDFSNVTGVNLLGNAAQAGTAVRLTTQASNQTGWCWHRQAMPVVAGFDTSFTFRITPPTSGTLAEGMALVLHDDPNGIATRGGTIWGMGYGQGANSSIGIRNSIAVEIDTFRDGFLGDTSANEVTIHTLGAQGNNENENVSIGRNTPATTLSNGQVHTLRVRYVPGTLGVFLNGAASPIIQVPYDFATGGTYLTGTPAAPPRLANGTMFAGFCATTGNGTLWETVEVLSWDWTSVPLYDPCYDGTLGADVLTVGGSAGDARRVVSLFTHQGFPIDVATAPGGFAAAPFVLLVAPGATPGVPGTATPIGASCLPIAPVGPGVLVLADSFGIVPAPLPASPAPFSLQVPPLLVTLPLSLTVQGVMAHPGLPLGLGLTNAIDVRIEAMPAPVVQLVSPLSAVAGAPVRIVGAGFAAGVQVDVNGVSVTPSAVTPNEITFAYPGGLPCDSNLVVTNLNGLSASATINPTPAVTGTLLGTGSAAGGAVFVVQGQGFAPGTTVTIGGAPATVLSVAATVVSITTPPGTPGVAPVVLTTPGGCTANTTYTYQ